MSKLRIAPRGAPPQSEPPHGAGPRAACDFVTPLWLKSSAALVAMLGAIQAECARRRLPVARPLAAALATRRGAPALALRGAARCRRP